MTTDARTRYTKMVIQNSFLALLKEKPINKITVKEVCEMSEINRATFYRYYKDPYDWLEQTESIMLENTKAIIQTTDSRNLLEIFTRLLTGVRENFPLIEVVVARYGANSHSDRFLQMCVNETMKARRIKSEADPGFYDNMKDQFNIYGCSGAIRCWIESGMVAEPAEVAGYIEKLVNSC